MKKTKFILPFFIALITVFISVDAFALGIPAENTLPSDGSLFFDSCGLIDDETESALESRLNSLKDKYGMDIAIVTVDGLDGKSAMAYADDYYDFNNYGNNGAVLLISIAERDWWFSTKGTAIDVFYDDAISYIFSSNNVLRYFGDNDWQGGFNCFITMADECIAAYKNNEPYTDSSPYDSTLIRIAFCCAVGFIAALIYYKAVKAKYKTVKMQKGAKNYLVEGSLHITNQQEIFMYSNVSKTAKPQANSSSGSSTHTSSSGSSTHTSSAGSKHGGSGGKF